MFETERNKLLTVAALSEPGFTEKVFDGAHSRFVIRPLMKGFGLTLGNTLRRVLLASMPGAAVVYVKITGAVHEFSTLPEVKEDVCEIIQNIKLIRANLFSDSPKRVYLRVQGPAVVTAGDIQADSELVIINPEQPLATVGKDGVFEMELTFDTGTGYQSADKNRKTYDTGVIGTIYTDSIYTPVKKVEYSVEAEADENGEENADRLVMDIYTDGTISPAETMTLASRILVAHFGLFTHQVTGETGDDAVFFTAGDAKEDDLNRSVEELELSVRSSNCLRRAGIGTVRQLVEMNKDDVMHIRNLGKKSFDEIVAKLDSMGLCFHDDD